MTTESRLCARCNHDMSEYADGLTICAACEAEILELQEAGLAETDPLESDS